MLTDWRQAIKLAPRITDTFFFAYLQALYLDAAPDSRKAMDEAGCGREYLRVQQETGFAVSPRHVKPSFFNMELTGQVMTLFQKGDEVSRERLKEAFPDVWEEWQARQQAKNGMLDTDRINREFEEAEQHDQSAQPE